MLYALLIAAVVLAWYFKSASARFKEEDESTAPETCLRCGYDLRGTPERCPECNTLSARGRRARLQNAWPDTPIEPRVPADGETWVKLLQAETSIEGEPAPGAFAGARRRLPNRVEGDDLPAGRQLFADARGVATECARSGRGDGAGGSSSGCLVRRCSVKMGSRYKLKARRSRKFREICGAPQFLYVNGYFGAKARHILAGRAAHS